MRLLAYGGREWGYQCKIGDWPTVSEASLRDSYGVPAGSVSYGVGFIGGQPCLVYRERQNVHERTGYPYTVLIDPSDDSPRDGSNRTDAWGKFNWNAAALLASLLEEGSERRRELLDPRTLTASRLGEIVTQATLTPAIVRHYLEREPLGKWALIVYATAMSSAKNVVVTPGMLDIPERPSLKTMAEWLEALPWEMRLARGWMVGMSTDMASDFGATLTLDDLSLGEAADPEVVKSQVAFASEAWRILDGNISDMTFERYKPAEWPDMLADTLLQIKTAREGQEIEERAAKERGASEKLQRADQEAQERAARGAQQAAALAAQTDAEHGLKATLAAAAPTEPTGPPSSPSPLKTVPEHSGTQIFTETPWMSSDPLLDFAPATEFDDFSKEMLHFRVQQYVQEAREKHEKAIVALNSLAHSKRRVDVAMELKIDICELSGLKKWEALRCVVCLLRGKKAELEGQNPWNALPNEFDAILDMALKDDWRLNGPPKLLQINEWCSFDGLSLEIIDEVVLHEQGRTPGPWLWTTARDLFEDWSKKPNKNVSVNADLSKLDFSKFRVPQKPTSSHARVRARRIQEERLF